MAYKFDALVDPKHPIDPHDPAPPFWKTVDEIEHTKAIYGKFVTLDFMACRDWECRERERFTKKKVH